MVFLKTTKISTFIKLSLILLISMQSWIVFAQSIPEDEVALTVLKWHYNKFVDVQDTKWTKITKQGETMLEASFIFKGKVVRAWYNEKGAIIKHHVQMNTSQLPSSIDTHLAVGFGNYKVKHFYQVYEYETQFSDPVISYQISLKQKHTELDLIFDQFYKPIEGISNLANGH